MKSVVVDSGAYDWGDDVPLRIPFTRSVLYELHIGGFTKHPTSGVAPDRRGTYAGLVEKIPYLHDLGVTAVELLPVYAFDEQDCPPGLTNYWGYSPISFFAPMRNTVPAAIRSGFSMNSGIWSRHSTRPAWRSSWTWFTTTRPKAERMAPRFVTAVWQMIPTIFLRAIKAHYANYTGCGNTLNANESICRRLILDSLRYWVSEMHVDGFRFDLASILSRDKQGAPMPSPPVLSDIESDPVLANVKLIAEAWDAAGLYQVGRFPGESWKEWNGRYRDDVRSFVKGDNGMAGAVAHRLLGSPDIYQYRQREPEVSINFVTCHDGFTLNDVVSYNDKHNEANREANRDGAER